ncbi:polysaccharide pyruvyl transferase family protein [Vibrio cyclitrophicus]|nr:polysaccharide pyruvyl transferase family protein [Vibrio cyclitrophicus]UPR47536.1 polysaccharide pyruvyl transferase family protein [Vibrio cyclitrophicus]
MKGVQFENKGAELMLQTLVHEFSSEKVKIVLAPGLNSSYSDRAKVGAYQLFNISKGKYDFNRVSYLIPKKLRGWLNNWFGIVFESDLTCVLDASGFAYGDQWPELNSERVAKQVSRLKRAGKKYIFLPQAFGPFSREFDFENMQKAISLAELTFARDIVSFNHVKKMNDTVYQSPDFTCLTSFESVKSPKQSFCIIPNSNMVADRADNRGFSLEKYCNVIVELSRLLTEKGYKINLFNHEGASDSHICQTISSLLSEKMIAHEYFSGYDALATKKFIATQSLVFSSRFHGCVSALSQSVPCIGTTWSHKYEELFSYYGMNEFLIKNTTSFEEIEALISKYILDNDQLVLMLKEAKSLNVNESQKMIDLVKKSIGLV